MKQQREWFEDDRIWNEMCSFGFSDASFRDAADSTDKLIAVLGTPAGGALLDLCCGPGRYSLPIARRGYRVTAVDRTRAYLDRLRARAADAAVDIDIVEESMLTFRRENAFDSAINMLTSFGYFENIDDDRRVLENVYASLKPGGRFIMELKGRESIAATFQARDWSESGGRFLLQERTIEPGFERIHNRWIFIDEKQRREFNFYLRLYTASGLADMLKSIGFSETEAFADLDRTPYDQKARLLWIIATK